MKILFICGSLEPGRDGVGDYTRNLAAELRSKNIEVTAISLFDHHVNKTADEDQSIDNLPFLVRRIPAKISLQTRKMLSKSFVEDFDPDWISLQFVPYAYHQKGMPMSLISIMIPIAYKRKLHIMFHEIWIGTSSGSSWKTKLTAYFQKAIITQMAKKLKATSVHTHLPLYLKKLQEVGFTISALPLFSNISLENTILSAKENIVRLAFFSQIEKGINVENFLVEFAKQVNYEGKELELLLIGGNEAKMNSFKKEIEDIEGYKGKVKYAGFLTPAELSHTLQSCHLGISPVPKHGLGKSGTIAAFIAHGVPVAAPNVFQEYESIEGFFSTKLQASILTEPDLNKLAFAKSATETASKEIDITSITEKFILDLNTHRN